MLRHAGTLSHRWHLPCTGEFAEYRAGGMPRPPGPPAADKSRGLALAHPCGPHTLRGGQEYRFSLMGFPSNEFLAI